MLGCLKRAGHFGVPARRVVGGQQEVSSKGTCHRFGRRGEFLPQETDECRSRFMEVLYVNTF